MEIRNLNTFLQVVESGSFTRAAELLGYTQSTVSFQISQLEEELGCQLFDRIGHNISLTTRGLLLQEHALNIINSVESLHDDFRQDERPSGQIHIYTSDSICEKMMLGNYGEFSSTFPDIRLIFSTGSTTDLLEFLDRNESDVIFTLDNHVYRQNYIIARESPVKVRFVASSDSPLAGHKLSLADIIEQPLVLTEQGTSYRKLLDDMLAQKSLEARPKLETGRTDVLVRLAVDGMGITMLPEFSVKEHIDKGELVYLDVEDFDMTIWKQLIYRKDKWISRTLRSFLDFVISHEFEW